MRKKGLKVLSYISLAIPLFCIFFVINYFVKIVPFINLKNISLFAPLYMCTIGFLISIISFILNRSKLDKIALVLNGLIASLELLFILIGTVFIYG